MAEDFELDLEELRHLQSIAKRPRIVSLISSEIWNLEKIKLCFKDPQGKNIYLDNSLIAAAEMRNSELLAVKENLDKSLATDYQIRAQLQKQLHNILIMQNQERMKLTQFPEISSNSRS